MKNTQNPLARDLKGDGTIFVHHLFSTIQGEGPFAGKPATFVRLYGCNLQCPFCDTDYTSQKNERSIQDLFDETYSMTPEGGLVVFTGGEPFRQNITGITEELIEDGYHVQVETNGTFHLEGFPYVHPQVTVVCSPKTMCIPEEFNKYPIHYKYVVDAATVVNEAGIPCSALGKAFKTPLGHPNKIDHNLIYIQPMDEQDETKNKAHLDKAMWIVKEYNFRLCLQLQKILNLE